LAGYWAIKIPWTGQLWNPTLAHRTRKDGAPGSQKNRDLFLVVLEQVRRRYHFVVEGYVVMPEHVHLLFVTQAIKQGFARRLLRNLRSQPDPRQGRLWSASLEAGHIWQRRFYDFVVFSEKKRVEKLRYMHRNPVKRGLVLEPQQWVWSSFRHYADGERGAVLVNEAQKAELRVSNVA
jgi:putative transposase